MTEQINAIIIDDEKLGREIVKNYLNEYPTVNIAAECSNGFDGIKKITELKPDLIFLDIQMPKINGFEMLELIDNAPVIIFTTAYDHFALKAFEVNAADYLLKPFSKVRFDEAFKKALLHLKDKPAQKSIVKNLIEEKDNQAEYLERIVIKDGTKIFIVPVENVKYIEAQDDYVKIYSDSGNYLKQKTMKYFEAHLNPENFIRIHRSYIAAVDEIKNLELFEKESYRITLKDAKQLPVSKNGYEKLREIFR